MRPDVRALIASAIAVRQQAYAKYSDFLVGAALLAADGRVYCGCNVENVSYGLTNCAERTAVFSAVAAGQRRFELLAIASAGGVTPCGACRQVLAEFSPELPILLVDVDRPGQVVEANLRDLLPGAFTFDRDAREEERKPRIARIKRMKSDRK
jgi:cytidine deaminase